MTTMTANAETITFGIELETTLRANDTTAIGGYHGGTPVSWLPEGWKAERDSSIRTLIPGRKGCEFVSPKLKGAEGIAQVMTAVEAIKGRGARVNASCGLHITVTFPANDGAALARLLNLVGNHEKALFATTGTRRREDNRFCKKVKDYNGSEPTRLNCSRDRYHAINLTHLAAGANRIEFRLFAGSLNATKIAGHLMMVLGLVEMALNGKRNAAWDYQPKAGKPGPWVRKGAGAGLTELNRLFYRLGWTKGHNPKACGVISGEGIPALKAIKAKLTEMAVKYDGSAPAL